MAASGLAAPIWDINHVISYGQSLSIGWDGWPALSTTLLHDCLMLGHSVRGIDPWSSQWAPQQTNTFTPLIATTERLGSDTVLGETVLEMAVNLWRGRMLEQGRAAIGGRRLLASACGVGGQSLEALSKGAATGYYSRLTSCFDKGREAARATGANYGVTAILFLQGEANSSGGPQTTSDRREYKELLRRFIGDVRKDLAPFQQQPPAVFAYQTAGSHANETVSIGEAQLELALEDPSFIMVAPAYALTGTPTGHLDANGYRALGAHFGRVMHRVLDLGEAWRPLHPIHVSTDRTLLTVAFHVPVPPLVWGHPIPGQSQFEIPDRGFTVLDEQGPVPIDKIEIVSAVAIAITLARSPGPSGLLRYAARRTHGIGCLCDSDPDIADGLYTFDASTEGGFQANLPDRVGKPYPLTNWCVGFAVPVAAG